MGDAEATVDIDDSAMVSATIDEGTNDDGANDTRTPL